MKTTKSLFASILMLFLFNNLNAQISLGGQLNFTNYAGYGVKNLGVGVGGDYTNDRMVYKVTLNYSIVSKKDRTFDLYYNDGNVGTSNQTLAKSVTGFEKYSGIGLWLDANYFFTGDGEDGGLYGLFGAGLNMMTVSYDIEDYDKDLYTTFYDYESKDRLFQPILRFGLGYDLQLDFGNLYFQAFGNLPANKVGGADIEISLPFSFGAAAGVRIPLD